MKLEPPAYIDLTGHLASLRGSLTPACRHFEAAPPLYVSRKQPFNPAGSILRMAAWWLALTALGVAVIALW